MGIKGQLGEHDTKELDSIVHLVSEIRGQLNGLGNEARQRVWVYLKAKFDPEIFPAIRTASRTAPGVMGTESIHRVPLSSSLPLTFADTVSGALEDDE